MDRLDALEQRVAELEKRLALKQDDYRYVPAVPHEFGPGRMPKCGCPIGSPCNSVACPHMMQPWASISADDMATIEIKPGSLRVASDLKDSVIPWWRDQWEEGV